MEKLTDGQKKILDVLKRLVAKNGYPPTVREIGKEADLNSPATTFFHLKKLEEKGYIRKDTSKNRTIEILVPNEYLQKEEDVVDVPLLGKVTAGTPIEAIETPNEYFSLPANFQPSYLFFLYLEVYDWLLFSTVFHGYQGSRKNIHQLLILLVL